MRTRFFGIWYLALGLFLASGLWARGATPTDALSEKATAAVDLFAARDAAQIDAKLIPHDSKAGTVVITNRTKGPLTIKLPAAFAGVPILAQVGRRGGGVGGGNIGGGVGGGSQGLGGGFGGGGGLGGGGIGGGVGGVFNIGPERVVKLKVVAVCLEHGKPEPNPHLAYELAPLGSFTSDAEVIELVEMLGRGELDQRAAQAAAWHLANGLSWDQLASKVGVKHLNGTTEPYFSASELERAHRAAVLASHRAIDRQREAASPGESLVQQ
jgi:hypothetical protein